MGEVRIGAGPVGSAESSVSAPAQWCCLRTHEPVVRRECSSRQGEWTCEVPANLPLHHKRASTSEGHRRMSSATGSPTTVQKSPWISSTSAAPLA